MRANQGRADIVLHPQRMAILRALGGEQLTAKQIGHALPDIPQATLYRHLGLLLDAGVITVVAERPVRGTTERTYALAGGALLDAADLADASRDDHFRYFTTFVSGLLAEFAAYLERPEIDLGRDAVGYQTLVYHLTDAEMGEMLAELGDVLRARLENQPTEERTPRLFTTITMPATRPKGTDL